MRRTLTLLLLALAPLPPGAAAQLSLAPKIGTLGVGADLGLSLGRYVTLRAGYGTVPPELDANIDDIDYTVFIPDVVTLGVDLHPGGGGFRISGGVLLQTDELLLTATPAASVKIGEGSYTPDEVGTLRAVAKAAKASPFAMIGFGHHGARGWGAFLDLGLAFVGPRIRLTGNGTASGDEAFLTDLDLEEARLEHDFRFWPVVQVGMTIGLGH